MVDVDDAVLLTSTNLWESLQNGVWDLPIALQLQGEPSLLLEIIESDVVPHRILSVPDVLLVQVEHGLSHKG
ncbi:hypothetical protein E2C01_025429 [Portunus trituberculatus]|uniref:Uncharacterized protein n=1 Tax=Portunus trituberculatus TaxID=210409 RepID=A0A5B7EFI0_PORTR|nr:hypothetical protein [Portunus trituberculatus]